MSRVELFITKEKNVTTNPGTDIIGGNLDDLVKRAAIEWMTAEVLKPPIVRPEVTSIDSSGNWTGTPYETGELFAGQHTITSWRLSSDQNDLDGSIEASGAFTTPNLESGQAVIFFVPSGTYYFSIRYESNNYTSGWSQPVTLVK